MNTLKRLSVVMSVFGAGLVVAACASPTDAEIAEPAQQQDDVAVDEETDDLGATSSELVDEAEEAAEDVGREAEETAEDVERAADEATDDPNKDTIQQEQRHGPGAGGHSSHGRGYGPGHYGRPHHDRRWCSQRDNWHCRRGEYGWRWVYLQRDHRPGYGGEWQRRPQRCCMRVHIRDHRGGPRHY